MSIRIAGRGYGLTTRALQPARKLQLGRPVAPKPCSSSVPADVVHPQSWWYTAPVPTTRPRHQITETPAIARAIDLAARHWPDEPRSKLLRRLVDAGGVALEAADGDDVRRRIKAVEASSGKYADAFSADYLAELRRDWPE